MNALEVNHTKLINRAAEGLKQAEHIKAPSWATYVKTGAHKQRPPMDEDWWFKRTAAVLRSVYKLGPIGTSKLRTKYGGRKNKGVRPEKFYRGSGSVIRKVLQQLEKEELIAHTTKGVHKGRVVTPKGRSFLDKIAVSITKEGQNGKV